MPAQPTHGSGAVLTPLDAAKRLCVHPETVRRWVREGRLPAIKVGGGKSSPYRIYAHDLEAFIEAATVLDEPTAQEVTAYFKRPDSQLPQDNGEYAIRRSRSDPEHWITYEQAMAILNVEAYVIDNMVAGNHLRQHITSGASSPDIERAGVLTIRTLMQRHLRDYGRVRPTLVPTSPTAPASTPTTPEE